MLFVFTGGTSSKKGKRQHQVNGVVQHNRISNLVNGLSCLLNKFTPSKYISKYKVNTLKYHNKLKSPKLKSVGQILNYPVLHLVAVWQLMSQIHRKQKTDSYNSDVIYEDLLHDTQAK